MKIFHLNFRDDKKNSMSKNQPDFRKLPGTPFCLLNGSKLFNG